jgi:hypothetical protein
VIAEDFLAENSPIDLLATGGSGELVTARIGRRDADMRLLTQTLADRVWLRPRLEDWLKLAPELEIDPAAEIRAMLFCPDFQPETRAAVCNFPPGTIELVRYRCLRQRGQLVVLLERDQPSTVERDSTRALQDPLLPAPSAAPVRRRLTAPPSKSCFRTGLVDADLRSEPLPSRTDDSSEIG